MTPARTLRAKSAQKFANSDRDADRCRGILAHLAQTPDFPGFGAGHNPATIHPAVIAAKTIFAIFPKNQPQPKNARSETAEKWALLRNTDGWVKGVIFSPHAL